MQSLFHSASATIASIRQASTLVVGHAATAHTVPACIIAARGLGATIDVLITGHGDVSRAAGAVSTLDGVSSVIIADHPALEHDLAEPAARLVAEVVKQRNYGSCIMPAGTSGKNILPRAAALLGSQPVSDVISVESSTEFRRPTYAGNAIETVQRLSGLNVPLMLTIRPTSFDSELQEQTAATVKGLEQNEQDVLEEEYIKKLSSWVSATEREEGRPDLGTAKTVVSGGRALKSSEHFHLIEELADSLGGAVGASRAAVDAGMVPNDLQVGQTGKVVAPDLYIAAGISGAIQHVAGIKDSKVIVAINTDESAPIFQVSDIGLVGDLFEVVPKLTQAVKDRSLRLSQS